MFYIPDLIIIINNNCLKSNIQCIEIRVQWTMHLRCNVVEDVNDEINGEEIKFDRNIDETDTDDGIVSSDDKLVEETRISDILR